MPRALKLLAALLAAGLVAPFLAGIGQMGMADWPGVDWPGLASAAGVSVASATLATLGVAVGGIPLGYLLVRRAGRWMATLGFVVQLPLALPPLASGTLLLFLLGWTTPLGRLTNGALTDSFIGIVLAEAFVAAPFLIIAARSAFAEVDPVLEDVAATLGHLPRAVFFRVSLALAWRGIAAGLLLCWLRAFGEFGATVLVAYHPYSLPVFSYVAFGSEGLPAMLPVVAPTLVLAGLVMAATHWLRPAPPRPAPHAEEHDPAALPSAAALPAPAAQALDFAFRLERSGFTLVVAWRTRARRLAILGGSGSGKSATLRLIAGLDQGAAARLSLAGADLHALPPPRRGIAYVPQAYGLFPHLPLDRQVRFAPDHDEAQAQRWIAQLGLAALTHRLPRELSLGQQQRTALARALARPHRLLLLDEPFSALDAPLRARLRQALLEVQRQIAATTILVTHDPEEAMLLAEELLLLDDGKVVQSGPAEQVFRRPANALAARLLGAAQTLHGVLRGGALHLGSVSLDLSEMDMPEGPVGWAVAPGAVRLVAEGGMPAAVLSTGPAQGGMARVRLHLGDVELEAAVPPGELPPPGDCRVIIDPASIQLWPETMQPEITASRFLQPSTAAAAGASSSMPGCRSSAPAGS